MARSYQCDHCKVIQDASNAWNRRPADWLSVRVLWPGEVAPEGVTYDLCGGCAVDLKTFLGREA